MDCGDAGHILLSKRVAEDLSQSRQWRPWLHDLGECAIKHRRSHLHCKSLHGRDLGTLNCRERVKQWQSEQAAQAADDSPSIFRRTPLLIAASALLTAVASFGVWLYLKTSGSDVAFATPSVLPIARRFCACSAAKLHHSTNG